MKILITGAGGMLGSDLAACLGAKHDVVGVGRKAAAHLEIPYRIVDLAQPDAAMKLVRDLQPEAVLHAAAMTDVDQCESERVEALRGNFGMTRAVVDAANQAKALFIFFSTDYVFDGNQPSPYVETDTPHPINVYGETKFLAEKYILIRGKRFLILRASWTFGKYGNNFPKKVLKLAETGKPFSVVSDQYGNPTYTEDLAGAVAQILEGLPRVGKKSENQIYHVANAGRVSRYEFARTALKKKGLPLNLVVPVTGEKVVRPAKRPENSVLSTDKLKEDFGIRLRGWEKALEAYLEKEKIGVVDAKN